MTPIYIWFWQLMSQRRIIQSCLTYAKKSLKKNGVHTDLTSAHVQLLEKNAERVDIKWREVQSIFSVSQTATRTAPADIYCAMQAVISSFRKIQGIQIQSCFSSALKTFKNHLVVDHLLGSILPPFLFNTHWEEETQPLSFFAENTQLIPCFTLHRCRHCYL